MRIGLLDSTQGMPRYLGEMLDAWGLAGWRPVTPAELQALDPAAVPLLVCPAGDDAEAHVPEMASFAGRGGVVVACLPSQALASAAGVARRDELATPLRLRLSALPAAGVAGELLPIVGRAARYEAGPSAAILAHLSRPGGHDDEGPAIIEAAVGRGRLIAVAFDLALSVMLCRQGDPARAETIPAHAGRGPLGARAVYMVADIGPDDSSWVPYADALGGVLVELVRRGMPAPLPRLDPLPGGAAGLVVYSGDEDHAPLDNSRSQMASLRAAGGRMNLYIIPEDSDASAETAKEYLRDHDLGPHPNLRPFDNTPIPVRLEEFARQVRLFETKFGTRARSLRNHCVVWVGYTEMAEAMERLGVRMDGNFNYGSFTRSRDLGPYAGWGAAMPLRFCRSDGRLIDVRQQHTHLGDDQTFSTFPQTTYSYRLSPEVYEAMARRILGDIAERFHVPYAVNIHPSNWAAFSAAHSDALLREANRRGLPVWSFDQWSAFCDARATWVMDGCGWDGRTLAWRWRGEDAGNLGGRLWGVLPRRWRGLSLARVEVEGAGASVVEATRHHEAVATFSIPSGMAEVSATATYEPRTGA